MVDIGPALQAANEAGAGAPWADWLVAAGTLVLAGATFFLAFEARREVSAVSDEIKVSRETMDAVKEQAYRARQQVGVAQDALAATFRPVLVNVPHNWRPPYVMERERSTAQWAKRWHVAVSQDPYDPDWDDFAALTIPLRNVGAGTALISRTAVVRCWPQLSEAFEGHAENAIIPPGEATRIRFRLPRSNGGAPPKHRAFTVDIEYEDLGGNKWVSEFTVDPWPEKDSWFVAEVTVKARGAPTDETVTSGQMKPS